MQIQQLDNLALESSSTLSNALVIMDASVKSNVATSISYIYIYNKPIVKMLYHAINITSTKTELFAIRCGINQATNLNDISKIIVVTNLLQTQVLKVRQANEPCIELTQENLIESSVQNCLPYIPKFHGLC